MFQSKQPQFEGKQWTFLSANVCVEYEKGRGKKAKPNTLKKKKSQFFSWHGFGKTTPPVLLNRPFPQRAHTSENDLCLKQMHARFSPPPRGLALGSAPWPRIVCFNAAFPAQNGNRSDSIYLVSHHEPQGTRNPEFLANPRCSLCSHQSLP